MSTYDAIVIGTGGVGSATLDHLARRGLRVLGLDRFPGGHDRGSSHGQTRIIRQAYFEHSDYVPLLRRAYELWPELETRVEQSLFHRVGLLEVGPVDGQLIPGVLAAAREHNLPLETLSSGEVERRWSGAYQVPDGHSAVFEAQAGFLDVEPCVLAHLQSAITAGAELRTSEEVLRWRAEGAGVLVESTAGKYRAAKLVITAGAWAADLLAGLGVPLVVRRKPLFWLQCEDTRYAMENNAPTFFYETSQGAAFYGFPCVNEWGLKVAEHSGGETVVDPLTVDRTLHAADLSRVQDFLTAHLPGVTGPQSHHAVCLYTMSPDEHFIIDRLPELPQVAFAAGLSGHGFKFTSVLGEILADLTTTGRSPLPIGFLSLARFQNKLTA